MLCALQTLAIIFLLGLVAFTLFIFPSILEVRRGNSEFQKPHTSHISFIDTIHDYNSNIKVDLKIEYPHGILIVNDSVKISGVVDATELPIRVISYTLGFYNAQEYPVNQDEKGITKLAQINFQDQGNNKLVANETKITWTLEGAYQPVITPELENIGKLPPTQVVSTIITVHPKSLMVQIIANNTNINLAIAAYFLGIIGAINIIYRLWMGII